MKEEETQALSLSPEDAYQAGTKHNLEAIVRDTSYGTLVHHLIHDRKITDVVPVICPPETYGCYGRKIKYAWLTKQKLMDGEDSYLLIFLTKDFPDSPGSSYHYVSERLGAPIPSDIKLELV